MIKKIMGSLRLALRVIKNLVCRPFIVFGNKVSRFFNAGKLTAALPGMAKKLPAILKTKPEKREDYFDWGTIYVAKSLVIIASIVIVGIPLLIIFVLAPLFTKWFGVKNFVVNDENIASYSGRVCIYYDSGYDNLKFEGKLSEGMAVEHGELYYEDGTVNYVGEYADDLYDGSGILYYEDGSVMYRGDFSKGKYEGQGEYTDQNGDTYSGTFSAGIINGKGKLLKDGVLYYEGNFDDGNISGDGRILYTNGTVRFSGQFSDGLLQGSGMEYYESGTLKYSGSFISGQYNGSGVLYLPSGAKQYSGGFEMGSYSGSGTLYDENGVKVYSGEFENGVYSGTGTLYLSDGSVISGTFSDGLIAGIAERTYTNGFKYNGCFSGIMLSGSGTMTDALGAFSYTGSFADDDFDYGTIADADVAAVKEMFGDNLVQQVEESCFYLSCSDYGISMKCSFATSTDAAKVTEIASSLSLSANTVIKSADDINAPNAVEVKSVNKTIPSWITERYRISDADCWAAEYSGVTVYYWTSPSTGALLLKSAEKGAEIISDVTAADSDGNSAESILSDEEIKSLFEDLGLNIEDFESLGF